MEIGQIHRVQFSLPNQPYTVHTLWETQEGGWWAAVGGAPAPSLPPAAMDEAESAPRPWYRAVTSS